MAAIRFSISHVKRYLPWLALSGVFLVIYEESDMRSTITALGMPYVIVVVGSPLMVVAPQLLQLPVRFAERYGLRTFMLLLILLIVVVATSLLAVGIGIDRLVPADRASVNARLAVLGGFFAGWVLIGMLLSRCVYRYSKLDIE